MSLKTMRRQRAHPRCATCSLHAPNGITAALTRFPPPPHPSPPAAVSVGILGAVQSGAVPVASPGLKVFVLLPTVLMAAFYVWSLALGPTVPAPKPGVAEEPLLKGAAAQTGEGAPPEGTRPATTQ